MKSIEEELKRIESVRQSDPIGFITSNEHKKDREWWILGRSAILLQDSGEEFPIFAEDKKPPDPDFFTYIYNFKFFRPVEIVEAMSPGRKRSWEYRKNKHPQGFIKQIPEWWRSLESTLRSKFKKRYEQECWLIVYHNQPFNEISSYDTWDWYITDRAKKWASANEDLNLEECPYERVLIINSNGRAMVSIFPEIKTIVPEKI